MRRFQFRSPAFLLSLLLTVPAGLLAQSPELEGRTTTPPRPSLPRRVKKSQPKVPVPVSGIKYDSGNRRDPFLSLLLLRQRSQALNEEVPRGTPPAGIAGAYIAQVVFVGTSFREEGPPTAIVQGPDKRAYFLEQGDRFFDGYLKSIGEDFILMVRQTKLRSGEVLAQDVTKRLRTP